MKNIAIKCSKWILRLGLILLVLYGISLAFFYFKQEKFFFNPKHLASDYTYQFKEQFEEINIVVEDSVHLNALLFKAKKSKGVVLYLHGNAGALHDWGKRAYLYLDNDYDVLFVDYRGYGKSNGTYSNETQLVTDMQKVYDFLKASYPENKIVVLGYSLGSGLAAYIAANNHPKVLILEAPYYSWKSLISNQIAPIVPSFLIKYDIPTYQYLKSVDCPIQIFHGTRDNLIVAELNAKKLKELYPEKIELNYIDEASHNTIHISKQYYDALKKKVLSH